MAEERGETLGQRVSFHEHAIEDRQRFGSINFCTTEVFLRHLQGNPDLYGFSHVVVDSVDDGSLGIDLVLYNIKCLLERRPELRLVMLSSLIEVSTLQRYFLAHSFYAVVMAPYSINLQQFFLKNYLPLLDHALVSSKDSEEFVREELQFAEDPMRASEPVTGTEHMPYSLIEAVVGQLCRSTSSMEPILVFLPSGEEISMLHRFLVEDDILKIGYANEACFQFIFVHPNIRHVDDVYRIDYRAALPLRKIYLCTAKAESTFPTTGVIHVIDTCKYKPRVIEMQNSQDLSTYRWASQMECVRRSRCAGRLVGVGSYYSLMSLERFTCLQSEALPELHRCGISYSALKTKLLCPSFNLEENMPQLLHPLPKTANILSQIETFKVLRAMVPIDNLTLLGRLLCILPLPVAMAKMIIYALAFRCLDAAVIIAAASMTGSPFIVSRSRDDGNPYMNVKSESSSDQVCILEAFNSWWKLKTAGKSSEKEFCSENRLSHPVLVKIAQIKQHIMSILLDCGLIDSMGGVFNRFIESPESKDALMTFLNENSGKWKLVQAVTLFSLYPNIALTDSLQWHTAKLSSGAACKLTNNTCAGRSLELSHQKPIAFLYANAIPSPTQVTISEITRASPLSLALFFGPDLGGRLRGITHPFQPPTNGLHVDGKLFFLFTNDDTRNVTAYMKTCLDVTVNWLFIRLTYPTLKNSIKEFTEEEIVRYADNVIRTVISLLESGSLNFVMIIVKCLPLI